MQGHINAWLEHCLSVQAATAGKDEIEHGRDYNRALLSGVPQRWKDDIMKAIDAFQLKNTAVLIFAGAILCIFVQLNVSEIQIEILKASVKPAYQTLIADNQRQNEDPQIEMLSIQGAKKEEDDTVTIAIMTTVTASTETIERMAVQEKLEFNAQRNSRVEDDIFPELHIEELEEEIDPTEAPTEATPIQLRVSQIIVSFLAFLIFAISNIEFRSPVVSKLHDSVGRKHRSKVELEKRSLSYRGVFLRSEQPASRLSRDCNALRHSQQNAYHSAVLQARPKRQARGRGTDR